MIRALALCLLLSGCLTLPHQVEHVLVGNQRVEIHTDAPSDPCSSGAAGCYELATHRIFLRSPVYAHTRKHEIAHADEMRHAPWETGFNRQQCALVTVGDRSGDYLPGQTICVGHQGEYIIEAAK